MISKIKLKIHVLGNKALFLFIFLSLSLSIALSPSFVSLSQAAVTCKYGSHISPLNNTRSREIYGCSRALRVLVSYESMARGNSVRNHPNASVI